MIGHIIRQVGFVVMGTLLGANIYVAVELLRIGS